MMAPPGQKQNPMRILYMLPVFFMANKIEYTDILVNILRVSYYVVQLATLAVAYFIKQKVRGAGQGWSAALCHFAPLHASTGPYERRLLPPQIASKQDNTKIFMPPVKIPFAPAPENPVCRTTLLLTLLPPSGCPGTPQVRRPAYDPLCPFLTCRRTLTGRPRARTTSMRWSRSVTGPWTARAAGRAV